MKYRKKVLTGKVAERLKEITKNIAASFGIEIIEQETDQDHIHILFASKPQIQVSKFVNNLKGVSSRLLRKEFPELKEELWGSNFWSHSYFIASTTRNVVLFYRFVNGNFAVDDVVDFWAAGENAYLQKAAECYKKLSNQEKAHAKIKEKFSEIRPAWKKPFFKGGSILLDYRVFSVSEAKETKEFNLWVEITSTQPHKRVKIPFYVTGKKLDMLEAFFPGWQNTSRRKGLLVIRERHVHLSIPVEKEKIKPVSPLVYIGCDVGISFPINMHDGSRFGKNLNDLVKKDYDEYLRLQSIRNKFRNLKEKAEKRYEITKNPAVREKLQHKIAEYKRYLFDHRWAELRRKIKATVKTEIGQAVNLMLKELPFSNHVVIVLENLSEMDASGSKRSKRGRFELSIWARGEFQDHIKRDLEWLGGRVIYVVPDYTSQKCSECGYVDKDNRRGDVFHCKRCGYTDHADVNAAKNIKERFFDEEINQLAKKYSWNKNLRREKIKELLFQRTNQAA